MRMTAVVALNLADLPIVPEKWRLQPRPSVANSSSRLALLHQAGEIIHAGGSERFWLMSAGLSQLPASASRCGVV